MATATKKVHAATPALAEVASLGFFIYRDNDGDYH